MIAVEMLTPARRPAFLASRNSLFTPVTAEYWDRADSPDSPFPVRTWVALDGDKVVAWSSFYLRKLELPAMKVGMACAIGTLPDYQRQGLGAKVWRAAEEHLAREADAGLVYTGERGPGFPFYRAMGYEPVHFPIAMRSPGRASAQPSPRVRTRPFTGLTAAQAEVFAECYRGYAGYMAGRPESLRQWSQVSFFYDPVVLGCAPQISWLEDGTAYAIWAGPITGVTWKHGVTEIWELACRADSDIESIRDLLQPALAAAHGPVDWWAVDGHWLTSLVAALGFVERPRSLCVLGKLFDPGGPPWPAAPWAYFGSEYI